MATFFVVLRNIALVINLLILIYSAIRMAISSVADEKAKYKKMCIDWLVSFVLIMTIQIIMAVAIEIMKILNNFLINIYNTLDGNTKIENNLNDILYSMFFNFIGTFPFINTKLFEASCIR